MQAHQWVLTEVEVLDAQIGDFLGACAGVVEEQQQGVGPEARGVLVAGRSAESCSSTSSRSRKWVSAGAVRFIGMAATRWQTPSISGSRVAM